MSGLFSISLRPSSSLIPLLIDPYKGSIPLLIQTDSIRFDNTTYRSQCYKISLSPNVCTSIYQSLSIFLLVVSLLQGTLFPIRIISNLLSNADDVLRVVQQHYAATKRLMFSWVNNYFRQWYVLCSPVVFSFCSNLRQHQAMATHWQHDFLYCFGVPLYLDGVGCSCFPHTMFVSLHAPVFHHIHVFIFQPQFISPYHHAMPNTGTYFSALYWVFAAYTVDDSWHYIFRPRILVCFSADLLSLPPFHLPTLPEGTAGFPMRFPLNRWNLKVDYVYWMNCMVCPTFLYLPLRISFPSPYQIQQILWVWNGIPYLWVGLLSSGAIMFE